MTITIEQLRHYFWSIFGITGIVFFWAGLWDGVGYLPVIKNPLVSVIIGITIISISGSLYTWYDHLTSNRSSLNENLKKIYNHPEKYNFHIKYYDRTNNKHIKVKASLIKKIEKDILVLTHPTQNKEMFIPIHRIKEILYKGKTWNQSQKK